MKLHKDELKINLLHLTLIFYAFYNDEVNDLCPSSSSCLSFSCQCRAFSLEYVFSFLFLVSLNRSHCYYCSADDSTCAYFFYLIQKESLANHYCCISFYSFFFYKTSRHCLRNPFSVCLFGHLKNYCHQAVMNCYFCSCPPCDLCYSNLVTAYLMTLHLLATHTWMVSEKSFQIFCIHGMNQHLQKNTIIRRFFTHVYSE